MNYDDIVIYYGIREQGSKKWRWVHGVYDTVEEALKEVAYRNSLGLRLPMKVVKVWRRLRDSDSPKTSQLLKFEGDKMLDMGYIQAVEAISDKISKGFIVIESVKDGTQVKLKSVSEEGHFRARSNSVPTMLHGLVIALLQRHNGKPFTGKTYENGVAMKSLIAKVNKSLRLM